MPKRAHEDHRRELPANQMRQHIINYIGQYCTTVLMGETGSGKSTQIPQMILEHNLNGKGMIAISQTRRVAAISLAKRVSQEQSTSCGDLVGYAVRFENCTSERTKIKYLTEGILLREAIRDKYLSKYSFVILDEAHERTSNTDILFGVVKNAQKYRKQEGRTGLNIIVMSATIEMDKISKYFNDCPVLYLRGRQHNVQVTHTKQKQDDFIYASLVTLFNIHSSAPANHDVLIFMPGKEEIDSMIHQIRSIIKSQDFHGQTQMKVWPLHSTMSPQKQMEILQMKDNSSFRRVIVATNIAETSLTIPGIKYVIDSGVFKMKSFDPTTGMESLKLSQISQAQAMQRTGRAGRESTGFCYRTYTVQQFKNLEKTIKPEILRCNLSALILQLMSIGIDLERFEFLDQPPKSSIQAAMKHLKQLGAIKSLVNPQLTETGRKMAFFPLDPAFSKIIICSSNYKCLEEALDIVSILSADNVFCEDAVNNRDHVAVQHSKFKSNLGDHFTLLNVFSQFKQHRENKWCHDNFLNARSLNYAFDIRQQLEEICEKIGLHAPKHKVQCNPDNFRKCLITGFFNNVAEQKVHEKKFIVASSRQHASIHPSSILSGYHGLMKNGNGLSTSHDISNNPTKIRETGKSNFVLFNEIVETSQVYLRVVSKIEPEWVEEVLSAMGTTSIQS